MRNLKFLLVLALCIGAFSTASAQITTGEPSAKTIRTGNRPGEGCFGLYVGATSDMFKGFNSNIKIKALPLLNFKYMSSDQSEWRLGLELFESSEGIRGVKKNEDTGNKQIFKERYSESSAMLYPGWSYHFSRNNIFDVYAGVEIPFGWQSSSSTNKYNDDTEKDFYSIKKSAFTFGIGAFIGVQAFIANLPLAVGVEYGISSRFDSGLKYKATVTTNEETYVSYSADLSEFDYIDADYEDLTHLQAKRGKIGNQIRITLSYYFK